MDYSTLIDILEISVRRHGEQPLTNKWLLNILLMAERQQQAEADAMEANVAPYPWHE